MPILVNPFVSSSVLTSADNESIGETNADKTAPNADKLDNAISVAPVGRSERMSRDGKMERTGLEPATPSLQS